jgi:hypothetical protein
MDVIREAIYDVAAQDHPVSVRQIFYRLVTEGLIAKTEAEYKGTVVRLMVEMRRDDELPFGWIADNSRWMRKPRTHDSLADMLEQSARLYRRNLWNDQDAYVEIWLEKEALAGVLYEVTAPWEVPLMVTRGYPSLTFVYEAAEAMAEQEVPVYLYYFGDHDPSGIDISRHVEERIEELAPLADITFERVAVTTEQIAALSLPTRPTKKTDTRSKDFKGESVEVDAIPPTTLRRMAEDCITQHIDEQALKATTNIEKSERLALREFASSYRETA